MNKILFIGLFAFSALIEYSSSYASDDNAGVTAEDPAPSPSGKEVVFSADFDGQKRIWAASTNGSNPRKISRTSAALSSVIESQPAWSPDGRTIAYVSSDASGSNIWTMQADGTYATQLTVNGAANSQPAWSPDGTKIVFVSDKAGTKDIWTMNANGTNQIRIVPLPGEENSPSYSPLGNKIVFSENTGDASTLMMVNANGTGLQSLTTGNFHDWQPCWSANGIVFSSNRDTASEHWKMYAIQPDGTGFRSMANTIGLAPKWLPDGSILFANEMSKSRAISAISILNPTNKTIQTVVDVQGYFTPVDIRPGKPDNNVNPNSKGEIKVSILSTRTFDAAKLMDKATITFGRTGNESSLSNCSKKVRDVNNDGLLDITCKFWLSKVGFQFGNTVGILRFLDVNGIPYEGRDSITTVPSDDPDDFNDED